MSNVKASVPGVFEEGQGAHYTQSRVIRRMAGCVFREVDGSPIIWKDLVRAPGWLSQ